MRFALVPLSLSLSTLTMLGACSGSEPVTLISTDDDDGDRPARRPALALDDEGFGIGKEGKGPAFLPPTLQCVSAAEPGLVPQVARLSISAEAGGARVWASRGPQFRSHRGELSEGDGVGDGKTQELEASVNVFGDVVLIVADGLELAIDGRGAFRSAEVFSSALFAGALTCWDDQAIWGSWSPQLPSALPARFDWMTGACVDVDGAPALNPLPIAFVRESGFGECADLRGQTLNGDDRGGPDLWMSLAGARLDGARLVSAQLGGSFEGADLSGLSLSDATLSGSFNEHTQLPTDSTCTEQQSPWGPNTIECLQ